MTRRSRLWRGGALAMAMGFAMAASAQVREGPGYYQPVQPRRSAGIPCGHYLTPACADNQVSTADAPPEISDEQLLKYSNDQFARGDKIGSLRTLERAADRGYTPAMRGAGMALAYGQGGVRQDVPRGLDYLERAAAAKDPVAHFHLGHIYGEGRLVPRDAGRAMRELLTSAEARFWIAEFTLGLTYEIGDGVAHDRAKAIGWFDRAARDTREQTPALYDAFLRKAGARRFATGDALAQAYFADYVRERTATYSRPSGGLQPGSAEWINRITGNSTACYFGGAPGCPRR